MSDPTPTEPTARALARRALRRILALQARFRRGELPRNDRGQELDRTTHALLAGLARIEPRDGKLRPIGIARSEYEELTPLVDQPWVAMERIEDRVIEGVLRARVYHPVGRGRGDRVACCLYFHGGGFVIGSPRSHEGLVRKLASLTGMVFVSVDYRLAPEHKAPAAQEDGLTAYQWLRAEAASLGIDPERIVISGDSAGGNLTLTTAIRARDAKLPMPCGLVPLYPGTDLTRSFPSHRELGEGYFLTSEMLAWFMERFLESDAQARDPGISPLFVTDLSRLPPTHLVTAGFDPLRDEGEAMATRLRESGVVLTHRSEDSLVHGFAQMGGVVPEAARAVLRIAKAMTSLARI